MKLLRTIITIVVAGLCTLTAVQIIYKEFYRKWQYYTLHENKYWYR